MLDTQGLSDAIYNLMTRMRQETEIKDRDFADALAAAITMFVMTGEVPAGIAVATTGSATAQTGATTAPGKIV